MCRRSRVARRWQIARSVGGGPSAAASQDYFPQGSVAFVRTYSSVRKVQIRTAANLCNKLYCSAHAEKLVYTGEQEQRLHLRNVLSCTAYPRPTGSRKGCIRPETGTIGRTPEAFVLTIQDSIYGSALPRSSEINSARQMS